jgi:capsular polysaccharide biosynthesis protein
MQLRRYGAVLRRHWLLIAGVVLVAALGGGVLLALTPREYSAEVRLLLNRVPVQAPVTTPDFRYDDYYRFLATEYVLDDLVEEVRGNRFALAVLERLHNRGIFGLNDATVQRALKPERAHRILTVEVVAPSREAALAMTSIIEELLTANAEQYAPPDGSRVRARVIHSDPVAQSNLTRVLLTYALQLLLALLLGVGLAFLIDYLDDRVRGLDDAQALGVPLLGRIPATATRAR